MAEGIGINPISLIAQIVNFGILLFVLSRFLYKPILNLLDQRAQKIAKGLKAAEENIKEREKLEQAKKIEMEKTRKEMEKMFTAAKEEARQTGDEIIARASVEAKKQSEKEFELSKLRLAKEEKEIRERMTKLTVNLAKSILSKTLDRKLQEDIFTAQLKKIKEFEV